MAKLIVLDASALIALASSKDPHHKWAIEVFQTTLEYQFQMTSLTLAEAMVYPAKEAKLATFQKMIAGLGVEVVAIEAADSSTLAKLRATTGLKMPDVVVLNQAIRDSAAIATTDNRLAQTAREKSIGVFHPEI